jgi:superfamily II DNA helicase RecQ
MFKEMDIPVIYLHDTLRGKAFRAAFKSLRNLRAILDCPIAMFTATFADQNHLDDLSKYTAIKKSELTIIAHSPGR